MKKFLLLIGIIAFSYTAFSQTNSYKKPPSIGFSFMFNDFKTLQEIQKSTSLGTVLARGNFSKLSDMAPGLSVNYLQGISDNLDFKGTLGGSFARMPFKSRATPKSDYLLLGLDANFNLKLLSDAHKFTPYLTGGLGMSYYKVYFGAYMPVGGGLQYKISDDAIIQLQTQYRIALTTDNLSNHLNFQLGFVVPMKKYEAPVPKVIPPVEKDTDSDGIFDSKDKCPTEAGVAKYDGCPVPDSDNDGINDELDKCPTVAGTAKYNGCPVPDTDGDKINDEDDKCPTVAGVARYQGCPVPDTDGDGLNDEEDKCITEAGPRSNNGCPVKEPKKEDIEVVERAATSIYFETGSSKLKKTSFKSLDEVATVLKNDNELSIEIEGHTDITGSLALNNKLSQARAESVKKYLASKGVDDSRMTATGFGPSQPVDTNDTAAGRAKNRRVVLKLAK